MYWFNNHFFTGRKKGCLGSMLFIYPLPTGSIFIGIKNNYIEILYLLPDGLFFIGHKDA